MRRAVGFSGRHAQKIIGIMKNRCHTEYMFRRGAAMRIMPCGGYLFALAYPVSESLGMDLIHGVYDDGHVCGECGSRRHAGVSVFAAAAERRRRCAARAAAATARPESCTVF